MCSFECDAAVYVLWNEWDDQAPAVLTQGTAGLDFTDAGTCTTNGTSHMYAAGDTCTVIVTFTPRSSGASWRGQPAQLKRHSYGKYAAFGHENSAAAALSAWRGEHDLLDYTLQRPRPHGRCSGQRLCQQSGCKHRIKVCCRFDYAHDNRNGVRCDGWNAVDGAGNVFYGVARAGATDIYELVGGAGTPVGL
jgi:hypothetical protein